MRADELRSRIAREPVSLSGASRTVTISVGVAVALPGNPPALDALVDQADRALYTAKQNGRNRVEHLDKTPASKHVALKQ